MGCFASSLNVSENPAPNKSRKMTSTEETKNPELYRRPSVEARPQSKMSFPRKASKTQASTAEESHIFQPESRKNTRFDLNKDLLGCLQKELEIGYESGRKEASELSEQDYVYKLSKEQHSQIYEFVRDKNSVFQSTINKLYQNLINNAQENDALYELMENLKSYDRDIRNCQEDLQAYPFSNEKKLYAQFEKNHQFLNGLVGDYEALQTGECSYENFKDAVLKLVINYNQNTMEKTVTVSDGQELNHEQEEKVPIHEQWDVKGGARRIAVTEKYMDNLKVDEKDEKIQEKENGTEEKLIKDRDVVEDGERQALEEVEENVNNETKLAEKMDEVEIL